MASLCRYSVAGRRTSRLLAEKVKWGLCKPEDRARALPYDDPVFEEKRACPEFGTFNEWLRVLD
jgi:hypothetical protein